MNAILHRARVAIPLALAVAIGACGGAEQAGQPAASQSADTGDVALETQATSTPAPADESAPPPATAPIRAGSPEEAIRAYYAAIDAGEFARAYRLWAREGEASGQSYAAFREGFASTRRSEVRVSGPVQSEGAAGSIYATVPVEVNAVLKDGTRQHFTGQYVLRRVNDVPGATEAQLHWHIESASLQPA
ncbi:MAG: hypothetical protein J0I69_11270 [Altererythrobacter sp.]|nr:hypothetical protein [Altererythrobacter sp.]